MQKKGSNAKLVKLHNQALVLKTIQQHEIISRKEISQITGLTQATITNITNFLIQNHLITETGKDENYNSSGRKPILLSIQKDTYKIITIYLGRHIIQGAVCDLAGNFLYKIEEYKNIFSNPNYHFETELINFIEKLIQSSNIDLKQVLGIGLSAPGPINAKKGIFLSSKKQEKTHTSPVPFDWRNMPVKEIIQNRFNVTCFADNEANVLALAEGWFGAGVGISNFVLYSIGVGIGAGVVIDGMLYRGEDDVVAEIGHITIDYNGEECICGNKGCLEHYASLKRLLQRYAEKNQKQLIERKYSQKNLIDQVEEVFNLAYKGDAAASEVVQELSEFLGIGAVTLANMYSPESIILSGNDAGNINFEILVPQIQENIEKRAFSTIADKVSIEASKLGKDNHLIGGVALVLQDFFTNIERSSMFSSSENSTA